MKLTFSCFLVLALSAHANETNTVRNGVFDWTVAESYVEERVPNAGDTVLIPAGTEVYLDASDAKFSSSLALINGLERLAPQDKWTSRLVVTVSADHAPVNFSCPFTYRGETSTGSVWCRGVFIKRGGGELNFTTFRKLHEKDNRDIYANLLVEEGTFRLPQDFSGASTSFAFNTYLGLVAVSNGATLVTARNDNKSDFGGTYVRELHGEGVITNTRPSGVTGARLEVMSTDAPSRFDGPIVGGIQVFPANGCDWRLTSRLNSFSTELQINGGATLRLDEFATSGGSGATVYLNGNGSRIAYSGEGGDVVTNKYLRPLCKSGEDVNYVDAGPAGGVKFACYWYPEKTSSVHRGPHPLVLTGSNAVPAELACPYYYRYPEPTDGIGEIIDLYFIKEGVGTWLFRDSVNPLASSGMNMSFVQTVEVREGTLGFDTLRERGMACSLGLATLCTEDFVGAFDESHRVPYAFKLGAPLSTGLTPQAVPTMELTGSRGALCTTRPFGLAGDARIKNDTDHALVLSDAFALANVSATLVLDASGAVTNVFADITNGVGTIGIAKTGTGVWKLTGNLDLDGGLDVREGTLVVRKEPSNVYRQFRWNWKRIGADVTKAEIEEFGLYDADGNRVNKGLRASADEDGIGLVPGQCGWVSWLGVGLDRKTTSLQGLFDGARSYGWSPAFSNTFTGAATALNPDVRERWLQIYMHLPEDTPEVASFDYINVWAKYTNAQQSIKAFSLDGSVDGVHWEQMIDVPDAPFPASTATWMWAYAGDGKTQWDPKTDSADHHEGGCTVIGHSTRTYSVEIGGPVKVSHGAKLAGEGDLPEIARMSIDRSGLGEIVGMTFAECGTVDFPDLPKQTTDIPSRCTADGFANLAHWTVSVSGQLKPGRSIAVSEGKITVRQSGSCIILR